MLTFLGDEFHADQSVDLTGLEAETPFTVGELTGDDLPDIPFIDHNGVGVLRGIAGRTLVGTAYPNFPIPQVDGLVVWKMDAVRDIPGDEPLVLIQLSGDSAGLTSVLLVDPSTLTKEQYVLAAPDAFPPLVVGGESSVRGVAAGELDPATPCDEYVLSFTADDRVFVGTACTQSGMINGTDLQTLGFATPPIGPIELDLSACAPGGSFEVGRPFVIDVDHDGALDVLITPEVASGSQASCVVHGPLTFADPSIPIPAEPAVGAPFTGVTLMANEKVLDLEDVNDDGDLDLVTSSGIFYSTSTSCAPGALERLGDPDELLCDVTPSSNRLDLGPLVSAAVGDLNGNGVSDIAVTDGVSDHVVVHFGAANGTFSSFFVDAEGFPDELVTGDFDGDGVDDLAFADRSCPVETCSDSDAEGADLLSVSFGSASGGPEPAVSVGRLGKIQSVLSARFRDDFSQTLDGTDDLGVLFTDVDQPTSFSFATLFGSTQRHLQAPFVLYEQQGVDMARLFAPLGLARGQFAELDAGGTYVASPGASVSPAHEDLGVVGFAVDPDMSAGALPTDVRLWLVPSEGEAELVSTRAWESERLVDLPAAWDPSTSFVTSASVDGDDADELIDVGGNGFIVADVVEVSDSLGTHPTFSPTLHSTRAFFESSGWGGVGQFLVASRKYDIAIPIPVVIADIDGDGARDIVALGFIDDAQVLVVYWNEAGAFDDASSTTLPLAQPTTALLAYNFDGDAELEIVLADATGASLVDVAPSAPRALVSAVPMPGIAAGSAPGTSLSAGDFDRDGVVDLVLGHDDSISLYRSLPGIE